MPFWSVLVFPSCRFGRRLPCCLCACVLHCSKEYVSPDGCFGSVCGGRWLVESFSWAGVGGLRVCFPGSGRDLSLMWGLPGRGSFFTPRRSVFLESHGHSFVPRNWPQICCCCWVCERVALFMGRPPHCRARNLAPHSGPLFLNKTTPFV